MRPDKSLNTYLIRLKGRTQPFGVTAINNLAALEMIEREVFTGEIMPEPSMIVCRVRKQDLDELNVRPQIGAMDREGIWYPKRA